MSENFEFMTRISDILSGKKSAPIDVVKVLHVDDEPDQLKLTKIFLEETDTSLQITSVSSPEEALERSLSTAITASWLSASNQPLTSMRPRSS
jgi:hypothetical protein